MPKRANNEGSIRQRPDGRWEARYTLGRDPGTGRQVQKSIYGDTQKEVRQRLQRIATGIEAGVFVQPSKMTVGQWLDVWLNEYCGNVKKSTLSTYKRRAEKDIKPALGAMKLSAVSRPAVQAFVNGLQRGEGHTKPLAPKSVRAIHGVLHKALQQAVELDYMRVNPATLCKLPRVEKPAIRPLEDKEITRFLTAIQGHENERAMIVALFTGMRQGELIGLTWDCVDFERGLIRLYQQLQLIDGRYEAMSLKNDKTRRITPASFVMDALREQRRTQVE